MDTLLVAVREDEAHVRVYGRGSFSGAPALKRFVLGAIEKGCRRLVMDMRECQGMDSTFMGVLAGFAMRLRGLGGEVVVTGSSPKNCALLDTLGLTPLLRIEPDAEGRKVTARELTALDSVADKREKAETMIEAHERLVEVSPDNQPKFKDVLEYLRDEIGRLDASGGGADA